MCSMANFYCQCVNRHMNWKFMRRVSELDRAIRQVVIIIIKNKLMSVCNASVLSLTVNFVITLKVVCESTWLSPRRSTADIVMMKFMINNRTDA